MVNLVQDRQTYPLEYWLGAVAGGTIGGALLFGTVAVVRNLMLRAR